MSAAGCPEFEELEQHASGRAAAELQSRVDAHQRSCADCSRTLEDLRADLSLASRVQRAFADGGSPRSLPAIAGYRVVRELGRGGMGVVYEAEELDPPRSVALKVVRGAQFVDEDTLRLFQREIRVLARLSHPGLAALHGAGRTDAGEHYFAMELVRGRSLTAAARALGRRERLELVRQLCEAIDCAHRQGVVHRDLKPSNVLVTDEGRVKVLDFGLAKITEQDLAQASLATAAGQIRGTLAYMSPEQARGDPDAIGLSSDVYSLGVVLYELLTGALPIDVFDVPVHEASRRICEDAPRRPAALEPALRGDLETIVLAALEKEPARRYAGAAALSEDLRRFLAHEPILARPASAWYELSRFVRRHRLVTLLVGAIFVLTLGSAVWTRVLLERESELRLEADRKTRLAEEARTAESAALGDARRAEATSAAAALRAEEESARARREAETARRVKDFLVGVFGASSFEQRSAKSISADELLRRGIERLRSERVDDGRVRAALLASLGGVCRGLHLNGEAEPLLQESVEILRREAPGSAELAAALSDLGLLRDQQHLPREALALLQEALGLWEALGPAESRNALVARGNLAQALRGAGELARSAELYRACLAEREARGEHGQADFANQETSLGLVLFDLGKYDEGQKLLDDAIETLRPAGASLRLANAIHTRGMIHYGRRDAGRAEADLAEALRLKLELLDPQNELLASSYNNLAGVRSLRGDLQGALEYLDRAHEVLAAHHPAGDPQLAMNDHNRARTLLKLGEIERAFGYAESALAARRKALGERHATVGDSLVLLGELQLKRGALEAAERALCEALPIYDERLGRQHVTTINARFRLGQVRLSAKDWAGAEQPTLEALADLEGLPGDQSGVRAAIREQLANLYAAWGKPEEAARYAAAPAPK